MPWLDRYIDQHAYRWIGVGVAVGVAVRNKQSVSWSCSQALPLVSLSMLTFELILPIFFAMGVTTKANEALTWQVCTFIVFFVIFSLKIEHNKINSTTYHGN